MGILLSSRATRDWLHPLLNLYARKAAEKESGYARALAPLFQAAGLPEEAARMWQMGKTSGNFLVNGGFEDGDPRPWRLVASVVGEVVTELRGAAVPEKPIEGKYCLYVDVAPDTPRYWLAALRSVGAVFEAGKKYKASAFLKARKGTLDIYFKPEQMVPGYPGFGQKKVTITDTWAQYHVTTPVFKKDVIPAEFVLLVGAAPGGFWVDDVRFYEDDSGSGAEDIADIDDVRLHPRSPEYYTPRDPGTANLLALYACEGNANDTSGHNLNGTVTQATFVPSERPGGSAVKVEKTGYLDLGNPSSLNFGTGDWTLTAWYKTAMTGHGDANKGTIVGKGGDGAGGKRYGLIMGETVEGVVTLVTDDDVTKYVVNSESETNDDQWHFVVGQREGTTLRIYIDGQLEGTIAIQATYDYDLSGTSQHNACIGAMTNNTDGTLYKLFNGLIDDVRFYNRALSQGEILWLMGTPTAAAKPF